MATTKATGNLAKPFFTIKEAADYIGVSYKTFGRYLKRSPDKGGPPRRRITSQCIRIPTEQFVAWIETKAGK